MYMVLLVVMTVPVTLLTLQALKLVLMYMVVNLRKVMAWATL